MNYDTFTAALGMHQFFKRKIIAGPAETYYSRKHKISVNINIARQHPYSVSVFLHDRDSIAGPSQKTDKDYYSFTLAYDHIRDCMETHS